MSGVSSRVFRFRPPGVAGVEIWNTLLREGPFWRLAGAQRLQELREQGLAEAEIARGIVTVAAEAVTVLRGLDARFRGIARLHLGGGLTCLAGFREAAAEAAFPEGWQATVDDAGSFVAAAAAEAGEVVVDVGQTAIKLASDGSCGVLQRDLDRLPVVLFGEEERHPESRRRAWSDEGIRFVAAAIAEALRAAGGAKRLWLGLPCELDEALRPGPCTYPGWEGGPDLVEAILAEAWRLLEPASRPAEVAVLNDSELAALAVRRRYGAAGRTLVMTLGFGPGGAIIS